MFCFPRRRQKNCPLSLFKYGPHVREDPEFLRSADQEKGQHGSPCLFDRAWAPADSDTQSLQMMLTEVDRAENFFGGMGHKEMPESTDSHVSRTSYGKARACPWANGKSFLRSRSLTQGRFIGKLKDSGEMGNLSLTMEPGVRPGV